MSIPGRDGELAVAGRLGPGSFTLRMWMAGDNRTDIMLRWEQLLRVAVKRHQLVRWEQRRADGTIREAYGRVVGTIAPTPIGRRGMRATIEVQIPSGVWTNISDVDTGFIPLGSGPLDKGVDLPGFIGASAPMTNLRYTVLGPIDTLRIICPETSAWAAYDGALAAGQQLHIDARDDIVTAPNVDSFRYRGPYMMELMPQDDVTVKPRLVVKATNSGTGCALRVQGRRAYLI